MNTYTHSQAHTHTHIVVKPWSWGEEESGPRHDTSSLVLYQTCRSYVVRFVQYHTVYFLVLFRLYLAFSILKYTYTHTIYNMCRTYMYIVMVSSLIRSNQPPPARSAYICIIYLLRTHHQSRRLLWWRRHRRQCSTVMYLPLL